MIAYNTHAESMVSNLQAATKSMRENSCNSVTESLNIVGGSASPAAGRAGHANYMGRHAQVKPSV